MSDMPWVRFFPSDWLGGTRGLSAAEAGVYINLLAMMYERGEPLPEDPPKLARLCGASNAVFRRTLDQLVDDRKILRINGGLWNERVEKESVYRSEKSAVGKQAAEKRWGKNKQKQRSADAAAMHSQCEGNANQKPDTRIEAKASPAVLAKARTAPRGPLKRSTPTGRQPETEPAEMPNWHGSAEEEFYGSLKRWKAAGVPTGVLFKIGEFIPGDFEQLTGMAERAAEAKNAGAYLGGILRRYQDENAPPPPPDPNTPFWVTDARVQGYPVEREGKYWRFAGGLFDDDKQQVGN